jgi:HD-GYP domain-containing protein (c-di-GMP phosphodiesterase class II)
MRVQRLYFFLRANPPESGLISGHKHYYPLTKYLRISTGNPVILITIDTMSSEKRDRLSSRPVVEVETICSDNDLSLIRALAELVGLAARLNSARTSDELMNIFARGLADIWPGCGIRLCRVSEGAGCLMPVGEPQSEPIPIKGSLLGRAAGASGAFCSKNLDNETDYLRGREAPSGPMWRSAIVCPISIADKPLWIVAVFLQESLGAGDHQLAFLERAVGILSPLLSRWESQTNKLAAFLDIARAVASAVDARDPHFIGHGSRVCEFAQAAARVHGFQGELLDRLGIAGLLHDLGRVGIPETLLAKPTSLTPDEVRIVQAHPELSASFLSNVTYLADVLPAIRHHHERFDGTGYPDGLEGEEIPLLARLLAVADAFDAMTSPRPFRGPLSDTDALAGLKLESGGQFDPILVEAFVRAYEEKMIISQNVLRANDPLARIRLNTSA